MLTWYHPLWSIEPMTVRPMPFRSTNRRISVAPRLGEERRIASFEKRLPERLLTVVVLVVDVEVDEDDEVVSTDALPPSDVPASKPVGSITEPTDENFWEAASPPRTTPQGRRPRRRAR